MVRPLQNFGRSNATTPSENPLNTLRGQWQQTRGLRHNFVAVQPRSVVPTYWTQPEMRAFFSDANRLYLRKEVLRQFNGIVGDDVLLRQMEENGSRWYLTKYIEETYGPRTAQDVQAAIRMMNERTLHRIGQLYGAQRLVTSQYLQFAHQGPTMNWEQPEYSRNADYQIEIFRN